MWKAVPTDQEEMRTLHPALRTDRRGAMRSARLTARTRTGSRLDAGAQGISGPHPEKMTRSFCLGQPPDTTVDQMRRGARLDELPRKETNPNVKFLGAGQVDGGLQQAAGNIGPEFGM